MENPNCKKLIHFEEGGSHKLLVREQQPALCTYCSNEISVEELRNEKERELLVIQRYVCGRKGASFPGRAAVFHPRCWKHVHDCPKCGQHTLIRRDNVEYCVGPSVPVPYGSYKAECNYYSSIASVPIEVNFLPKTCEWKETFEKDARNAWNMIIKSPFIPQLFHLSPDLELASDSNDVAEMHALLKQLREEHQDMKNNVYFVVEGYKTEKGTNMWIWKMLYIPPHQKDRYKALLERLSPEILICFFSSLQEYEEDDKIHL